MVETLSTAIFDQFESLRSKKPYVVITMCFVLFLCGLSMCLEGGIYMFELFNWYSAGLSVIILAITEIIFVQYVYGKPYPLINFFHLSFRSFSFRIRKHHESHQKQDGYLGPNSSLLLLEGCLALRYSIILIRK